MTQDTPTTVINVTVKSRGGVQYASSADLFGLHVAASNDDQMRERLIVAVTWLYKQNKGTDVVVNFASDPSDFPRVSQAAIGQMIVARAA